MDQPFPIVSDASLVGLVMRNILENAVVYANKGGIVQITARATTDTTVVLGS